MQLKGSSRTLSRFFHSLSVTSMLLLVGWLAVPGISSAAINVKDFGAVGDGKTNDTDAIQKAVVAAMKASKPVRIRRHRPHPKHEDRGEGTKIVLRPEIVFPEGTYRINRPIVFINYAHIRGEGTCVIQQTNPMQNTFYFAAHAESFWTGSIHFVVRGLRFEGGKNQIRIWPQNCNAALVSIDDCQFVNSTGYAVKCRMYKKPSWASKKITEERRKRALDPWEIYWQPFIVTWKNGLPYLRPNTAKKGPRTYNSTLLKITKCKFEHCAGIVDVSADTSYIRDTKVIANAETDGPIFKLPGLSYLYKVKGVATPSAGKDSFWIQGGHFSVRECDFDTTTPNGIDFIRMWAGGGVIVEDTRVKVTGSPSNALVWLGKRCQPKIISLIDVTETSGKPVKAIAWEAPGELSDLKNFSSTPKNIHPRQLHKILLARNSSNINETLPPMARTLREEPASADLLKQLVVPEFSWESRELWSNVQATLHAADFGLDSNPETDDTAVIQKIFDAAAGKGICKVIFPAGVYLVSEPIRLPAEVFVYGDGVAAFQQASLEKDIFHAPNAIRLGFRNILFKDGRCGIDIEPDGDVQLRIAFTDCWFTDQAIGTRCMTDNNPNNAQILIEGGYSDATQMVVSNAQTQIEGVWVFNGRNLENRGCFENHNTMRLQAILSVPARYHDNVMLTEPRWIDNFGKLQVVDFRFGGEGGGFCNVYNRSKDGTVYVSGSVSRSRNPAGKKCILYLEKIPKAAVLQTISTTPWFSGPYKGCSTLKGKTKNANVHISGLLSPDTMK